MNNLFTIVIPTYNRCQMLEESLQIAIPQVRRFKDDVSLYVSDNASTDDTQAVVAKYLQGNEDIMSYFRQPENIGGQRNFRHAVKAVNSKYVCLIGDDDVLFPNYVKTIVGFLRKNPDVGLINYNVMSASYKLENSFLRENNIRSLNPIVYDSGKQFIYEHLDVPSLISSNVFNREFFLKEMNDIPIGTYPGYDWLAVLYKSILRSRCIFVGFPLLLQRLPLEHRWAIDEPWFYIYGLGKLFKDMDVYIKGISHHWNEHIQANRKSMFNKTLIIVSRNQSVYRKRFEAMRPYMYSKEYENQFGGRIPKTKYGLGKYIMNQHCRNSKNIYNLRIFGTLNKYERYTKNVICNLCAKAVMELPLALRQDVRFSWVDIEDVAKAIKYIFENEVKCHDYNIAIGTSYLLSEMAIMIKKICKKDLPIIFENNGLNSEYTCRVTSFQQEFPIPVKLINRSLEEIYEYWYKNKRDINFDKIDSRWSK